MVYEKVTNCSTHSKISRLNSFRVSQEEHSRFALFKPTAKHSSVDSSCTASTMDICKIKCISAIMQNNK